MRVLIVDGFPPTPRGREEMEEFKAGILKGFEEPYNKSLPSVAFAVRDRMNLQDFLYDSNTEFLDRASLRSFKALDMVFIGGDSNLLPWMTSVRQVNIVMKMCLRASKPTFCSAFAMQMLAHLCQVGGEPISVFNGRGRGGQLASLHEIPEQVTMHLRETDLFLDAATGDLYRKSGQDIVSELLKYKNVGLFDPVCEPAASSAGKDVMASRQKRNAIPPPPYRPDARQDRGAWNADPMVSRRNEAVAEVLDPRNMQHWVLRGLPRSFLVPSLALWKCQPPRPPLEMLLSSSAKGPQVVLLGPMLGVQFPIRRKYPETETLVRNWIHTVCDRCMSGQGEAGMGRCPEVLGPEITIVRSGPSKWEERLREEERRERREIKEGLRGRQEERPASMASIWGPVSGKSPNRTGESFREDPDGMGGMELRPESASIVDVPLFGEMMPQMDQNPRSFSRAEIRKMLHPDIDITDVEPMVPLKVVRCSSRAGRPGRQGGYYNRWKYSNSAGQGAGEQPDPGYETRPRSTPPGFGAMGRPGTRAKTAPAAGGFGAEPPGFFRFAGLASTSHGIGRQMKNYVQQTAGPFLIDHKFRPNTSKESWKGDRDFMPAGSAGGWGPGLPVAANPSAQNAAVKAYQNKRWNMPN